MPRPSVRDFPRFFLACDPENFTHTELKESFLKNGRRNQRSGSVEETGLCRTDCRGGVELPDGNGLVPHEDERYGPHEVRRDAKRVWVRKPQAVKDHNDHEAQECAVFLAVAAARPRVPRARGRKRSARITVGSQPAQVG